MKVWAWLAMALGIGLELHGGEISGVVTLKGTPPKEKTIVMDQECSILHAEPVTTRHYVVGSNGGLANVFVYISKGLEGQHFSPPATPAVLDQVGAMYEPYMQGIMTGQVLRIKNSDDLLHNVHSISKVAGNKDFNFAQPEKDQFNDKTFTNREVMVKFKCDVHNWMFAYVGVMEHPFFAVTDKNGKFVITNVPPGEYTLTAYHQKTHGTTPGLSQTVKIEGTTPVKVDFVVEPGASK